MKCNSHDDYSGLKLYVKSAIDDYRFSFKVLSKISSIPQEAIIALYNGEEIEIDFGDIMHFIGVFRHLFSMLPINEEYVRTILEGLVLDIGVDYKTIELFSQVDSEKIKNFLLNNETLLAEEYEMLKLYSLHIFAAITKTDKSFGDSE